MMCPNCGKETPEGRPACLNCGKHLPAELSDRTRVSSALPEDMGTIVPRTGDGLSSAPTSESASAASGSEEETIRATLSGRYEILRKLGSGGMATVYLAREIALNREVAVKVLPRAYLRDEDFVTRFKHEAQVAANLEHQHIVRIHQIGEETDLCYFVMSHIPGGSIGDEIKKRGTIDLDDIIQWGGDACSALAYAHQQGVIHRDLKPDNIMLDKNRRAVVMDFGIARAALGTRLTQTGAVIGTPQYMSPEQAQGKELDGRSDIYSFGMVLYQMATGTLPFQSTDAVSLMYMHVHETPQAPDARNAKVPAWLRDIILKCLAKRPEDRFASAEELGRALTERLKPKISKTALMPGKSARKSRAGLFIGFAAALVILLGAGGYYWFVIRPQSAPAPAATAPAGHQAAPGEAANADDIAFQQAEMVNTEQAYSVYLKSYPSGKHTAAAQSKIETLKSQPSAPAQASGAPQPVTPQQTTAAPTSAPASSSAPAKPVAQTDASREDNLAFQQAEMVNTKQAYGTYLRNYPSGVHAADAKTKMAALDEQDAKTAAARAEEDTRKDDQAFQLAENTRTPDAYKSYLIAHPTGRHAADAKSRIAAAEERAAIDERVKVALNALSMRLVSIPGGSFQMGSDKGADEKPAHTVTLSAFQMTETEITQAQYQGVMGATPAFFKSTGSNPVERVSWFDAISFCNKLSEKAKLDPCYNIATGDCDFTKNGFRLPTEAEWEYACRAETGGDYYTGNNPTDLARAGWYADNSVEKTHTVGQKAPNAWKLFDMHGNVWEWCQDWYGKDYYGSAPKLNPAGPSSGSEKALRGGSWIDNAGSCKASKRRSFNPKKNYSDIGFRVVRR